MRKIKDRFINDVLFQKIKNIKSNLEKIEIVHLESKSPKELNAELMEAWMSVYLELDKSDIYLKSINTTQLLRIKVDDTRPSGKCFWKKEC